MILICTCKNEYQDRRYGKQKRVHNTMANDTNKARCTVCGNERSISGGIVR